MPLNPEEVVNKRFSATKFRQGYDEEEVDEFLDEVVTELRRLNSENTDLRSQLATCEGRVAELTSELAEAKSAPSAASSRAVPEASGTSDPVEADVAPPPPVAAVAPVAPAQPVTAPALAAPSAPAGDAEGAAGMLALAQRLHDEHVAAGRSKGDKLVSDAEERASRLVEEAETTSRRTLGALESQRKALETQVEELRSFEREYRSRLKTYLEGQLRELETSGASSGASQDTATSPAAGDGTPPRFPFGG